MSNDILHFGVKGMRWGVRKDRSSSLNVQKRTAAGKNAAQNVVAQTGRSRADIAKSRRAEAGKKAARDGLITFGVASLATHFFFKPLLK